MKRVDMKGLSFCLLNDDLLQSKSVMSIDASEGSKRTTSSSGHISTVFDPRLGTVTPGVLCSTCSTPPEICNGHTGHITLCAPVVSALFLPIITKILNSICIACGTLLLTLSEEKREDIMRIQSKKRLTEVSNRSLKIRGPCQSCKFEQPLKWSLVDTVLLRPIWPNHMDHMPVVTPHHISLLLSLITRTDANMFGFNGSTSHPSSMVIGLFPIPPTMVRPNRSSRLEDDLSVRLRTIVQANAALFESAHELNLSIKEDLSEQTSARPEWKPQHQRNKKVLVPEHLEAYFELQRQCAGFQDSKYCTKNDLDYGRELSSVRHRFSATRNRRGRVRANILGKRGDFTARAVASPNTYMEPHEVGVPFRICQHLTMKERVCVYNYQKMQLLVHKGPDGYPGANYVEHNGEKFLLPFYKDKLQLGDIVHRHLRRGDMVIMNRQPSLHRFSMMGYSVVPMVCNTFQLHLSVTKAHNLDYDGDEVNLFVPGSLDAVAEIQELMAVYQNLFKDGQLLIGFVQHACLAVYLLTRTPQMFLSSGDIQQMLTVARFENVPIGNCGRQTGREIIQTLLPVYDGSYIITKSKLNRLASRYLAASSMTSVARSTWIGCMVRFLEEFLIRQGSTLSYIDCVSDRRNVSLIQKGVSIISNEQNEAAAILVSDKLRNVIGTSVYADLSTRRSKNLIDIIESGAKGNSSHIVQNVGMVGQQFDANSNRHRELISHDAPPAMRKGMVVSSFSDGLSAMEFFFHLTSSRNGLIGTAVSTAETGYCYRRISKCLEDVRVSFDHSVRTASNQLVTLYGGYTTEHVYHIDISTPMTEAMCCAQEWTRLHRIRRQGGLQKYSLPFDIGQLVIRADEKDARGVSQEDIFLSVCALWDRLTLRFIPAHMEGIIFEILSSHRMFHEYRVRTHGRLGDVIAYVEESLCRSLYPPGTPIGLIVSQSFSEPLTQIQLNRFHHSGEGSGLVSGVTRIKEIINCMKDIQTPSMTIVPLEGHEMDTRAITSVTLKMVLRCWTTNRINMVTLILDKSVMVSRCITPRLVADAIGHFHKDIEYTDDLEATTWELWFPLQHGDTSPLRVRDTVRSLMKSKILIKGIKNIEDFYLSTIDIERLTDGITTIYKQPCIITRGSNMREICKLPWVDVQHTTTNDLMEIYAVFGIDAMCTSIEDNLLHVMASNSADVSRSYIHIIAHEMCRTGTPCALTFNGLTSSNTSTLKLATFERSLESFVRAACIGHKDELRGISESVIVGKPVSVGTGGDFEIINDGDIVFDTRMIDSIDDVHVPPTKTECKRTHRKRKQDGIETQEARETPETKRKKSRLETPSLPNPFLNSENLFIPYTR